MHLFPLALLSRGERRFSKHLLSRFVTCPREAFLDYCAPETVSGLRVDRTEPKAGWERRLNLGVGTRSGPRALSSARHPCHAEVLNHREPRRLHLSLRECSCPHGERVNRPIAALLLLLWPSQSAQEHRKARHAALRRMAELQESERTFQLQQLEHEREVWEVDRGLQVNQQETFGEDRRGEESASADGESRAGYYRGAQHVGSFAPCELGASSAENSLDVRFPLLVRSIADMSRQQR